MNQQDVQVKEAGGFESENRHRRIRRQAALHCAQVLAGMKASNIFIMSEGTEQDLDAVFAGTGIEHRKLCQDGNRKVYLLYRRERAERILSDPAVRRFFERYGYASFELDQVLERLAERYGAYAGGEEEFPHEIGLILEYPLCDVEGFIERRGKDFLFSGYWKVYGNPEETKKLFAAYRAVQKKVMEEVERGYMFWQLSSVLGGQTAAA